MVETSEHLATTDVAADQSTASAATPGVICLQTFRDNLPGVFAWGLGYSALIFVVAVLYPIMQENNTLLGLVRGLGLLGLGANNAINIETMTSFAGYLAFQALGWAPLVLSVYVIPQALNAVSREEERGTLDILLSTPIPRWRFLVEKTLAIVASLLGILLIMWTTLVVSVTLVDVGHFTVANATSGVWHIAPITLTIMSITLFISVSVRQSRIAGGLAALFVISSYFLRAITDLVTNVPVLRTISQMTVFGYYRSVSALATGFQWREELVLLALTAIIFAAALWQFQRRDIGV